MFLLAEAKLKVELIAVTPQPDLLPATAAHLCYAGITIDELKKKVGPDYAKKLLKRLTEEGHLSPLEHSSFTFAIEGISRACSHQLVRHRIASFSQQSQRYVKETGFNFIIPPIIKGNKEAMKVFNESIEQSKRAYNELLKTAPAEDARFVLPNACETRIIVTMNTRSLYNFFERRLCARAQWEIRALAEEMFRLCKQAAPLLFENSGPICERLGYCPERETCGRKPLRKDVIKK